MIADQSWRADAACVGKPTSWFFPETKGVPPEAALVCASCSVTGECLAFGLANAYDGVWGGQRIYRKGGLASRLDRGEVGHGSTAGYKRHQRDGTEPCEACRDAQRRAQTPDREKGIRQWA